jgi:hypothetical protein
VAPPCVRVKEGSSHKQPPFKPCESVLQICNSFGIWKDTECLPSLQVTIRAIRKNSSVANKPIAIQQECLQFIHSEQRFGLR